MSSLKADIRALEGRLIERRHRISDALSDVANTARGNMVSPGAIFAAGLFGALLDRGTGAAGVRLLTFLQAANASVRLMLSMSSGPSSESSDTAAEPHEYATPSAVA